MNVPGLFSRLSALLAAAVLVVWAAMGCFKPNPAFPEPGGGGDGSFNGSSGGDGATDGSVSACALAPEVFYAAETQLVSLSTADLNGDGKFEVLSAGGNVLRIWRGSVDAGLATTTSYVTLGNTVALAVGHYDSDSIRDVSVVNAEPQNSTQVFPGIGDGTLGTPLVGPGRPFVKQAVSSDFDGDGLADWALAADNLLNGEVYVLLDPAPATPFNFNYVLDATRRRSGVATGDWTQDSVVNLVASDALNGQLTVYAGLGDGGFVPHATLDAGLTPRRLFAFDLNHDPYPDVVAASPDDSSLAVLFGTSAGTLTPYARVPSNGGQPVDLAQGTFGAWSTGAVLAAEVNPGALGAYVLDAGVLRAAGTYATSSAPRAVSLSDLDGDGDLDVVALLDGGIGVYRTACP